MNWHCFIVPKEAPNQLNYENNFVIYKNNKQWITFAIINHDVFGSRWHHFLQWKGVAYDSKAFYNMVPTSAEIILPQSIWNNWTQTARSTCNGK